MNIARGEGFSGRFEKHTPGLQSTEKRGKQGKNRGEGGGGGEGLIPSRSHFQICSEIWVRD